MTVLEILDRKHPVKPGDLEDSAGRRRRPSQQEGPPPFPEVTVGGDEHRQTGRVDKGHIGQIDYDGKVPLIG